ncbi:hypothetical protein E8D37_16300 [Nocardioides sp. GY 10127]|nr:hypothetical protein E8D37_16300 [Nocardioides sp. GY 10127]
MGAIVERAGLRTASFPFPTVCAACRATTRAWAHLSSLDTVAASTSIARASWAAPVCWRSRSGGSAARISTTGRGRSTSSSSSTASRASAPSVIVLGTSFGAEAALLTGALSDRVDAVVAFAPSDVVWAGVTAEGRVTSHWSRHGRPLPFVSFDETWEPTEDPPAYTDLTAVHSCGPPRQPRARRSQSSGSVDSCWSPGVMTGSGRRPSTPIGSAHAVPRTGWRRR